MAGREEAGVAEVLGMWMVSLAEAPVPACSAPGDVCRGMAAGLASESACEAGGSGRGGWRLGGMLADGHLECYCNSLLMAKRSIFTRTAATVLSSTCVLMFAYDSSTRQALKKFESTQWPREKPPDDKVVIST